ncbi:MAG: deoxynucleoside kinase [Chloroflexota bacterium]
MPSTFIAIEGVIGVGKTTLARLLKPFFDASVLLEVFEENPFLADFYADRDRYAFQTQLFFLLSRYQQQKQAIPAALENGNLISDYTFAKDELFAWLNLKDDELAMYGRVHSALSEKIQSPDLLVYLHADHDIVMQRIALRDRPYERDMDPAYIQRLATAYEAWLSNLVEIPVLMVDVTHRDVISNREDLLFVAKQIEKALESNLSREAQDRPQNWSNTTILPQAGTLANYQEFHKFLDREKKFDPDLFYNYILLAEEMGELARNLTYVWSDRRAKLEQGHALPDAHRASIQKHKPKIGEELADLLAYILKLANYLDIDLEDAYLNKMSKNIERQWNR